jgi:hypothetical protein
MISQISLTSRVNNISNDEETDFYDCAADAVDAGSHYRGRGLKQRRGAGERERDDVDLWRSEVDEISQEQDVPRTESL